METLNIFSRHLTSTPLQHVSQSSGMTRLHSDLSASGDDNGRRYRKLLFWILTSKAISGELTTIFNGGKFEIVFKSRNKQNDDSHWSAWKRRLWISTKSRKTMLSISFSSYSGTRRRTLMNGECKHVTNNTLHVKFNSKFSIIYSSHLLSIFMQPHRAIFLLFLLHFELWFLCNAECHCCDVQKLFIFKIFLCFALKHVQLHNLHGVDWNHGCMTPNQHSQWQ